MSLSHPDDEFLPHVSLQPNHGPPTSGVCTIQPTTLGRRIFPPELFALMIRIAVNDSETLLQILQVSARIRNYILREEPDCASHILFGVGKNPFRKCRRLRSAFRKLSPNYCEEEGDPSLVRRVPSEIVRPAKHTVAELAEAQVALGTPALVLPSLIHPYVSRLHIRVRGLCQHDYQHIFHCFPNVSHLTVEYAKVGALDQIAFEALGKPLVHLELHQCGITNAVFESANLRDLRSLHLRACGEESAVTTALVTHLRCLEVLEVESIMTYFSWDSANFDSVKNTLRKLVMCHCEPGDPFRPNSFGAAYFPSLEVLILDCVKGVNDDAFNGLGPLIRKLRVKTVGYRIRVTEAHLQSVVGADRVVEMGSDFDVDIRRRKMGKMKAPSAAQRRKRQKAREVLERNKEVLWGGDDSFQDVGRYVS